MLTPLVINIASAKTYVADVETVGAILTVIVLATLGLIFDATNFQLVIELYVNTFGATPLVL